MKQLNIASRSSSPKPGLPGERSLLEGIREHVSQLSAEEVKVYLGQPENEAERAARKNEERNARAREARRIKKAKKAKR
jgi:hypothetical protein